MSVEHDIGEALLLVAGHQPAEDRIAVEARIAPPHQPPGRIDQRGGAAVSDNGKIQSVIGHDRMRAGWQALIVHDATTTG